MDHRISGAKFGRDKDHRSMMLRNLVTSLVSEGQITTTATKAKALKSVFDKLVNRAKKDSLANRKYIESQLTQVSSYKLFYNDVLPKLQDRQSGYTTTERMGKRPGDKAEKIKVSIINR